MKGTIFERGNKLRNKINRTMAWFRVKKYWLFMPKKEYKANLFYNLTGIVAWFIAFPLFVYYLILKYTPVVVDFFTEEKKETEAN